MSNLTTELDVFIYLLGFLVFIEVVTSAFSLLPTSLQKTSMLQTDCHSEVESSGLWKFPETSKTMCSSTHSASERRRRGFNSESENQFCRMDAGWLESESIVLYIVPFSSITSTTAVWP